MENDDRIVGKILTRREALALLGAASGAMLLAACAPGQTSTAQPTFVPATNVPATSIPATNIPASSVPAAAATAQATATTASAVLPACIVRPEVTEGPYYVDENLNRSDIRTDTSNGQVSKGAPLVLTFNVSQISANGCTPLQGARVEVWHCDAAGVYSGVSDPRFSTQGQNFLRGYQETDANGKATFATIYPGWYPGRTVHIHFKVRPSANQEFTSQLFFDDAFTDQVFTQEPYTSKGQRNTLNSNDNIYLDQLLLTTIKSGNGYAANFDIGMDMS